MTDSHETDPGAAGDRTADGPDARADARAGARADDPAGPALEVHVRVPTAARMRDVGERLGGLLRAGDLVVLSGSLGAGKTTLTQGIGAGLDVRGPVTSPTFVIARLHPSLRGGPDLVHADAYRLGSRAEVDDLDLDTDLDSSVTVVEWGEGLVEALAPSFLEIAIAAVPAPPDPEPPHPEPPPGDSAGRPPGVDPGGPPDDGDEPPGDADETRTVRLLGRGDRWREAASAVRQALAAAPDSP
jgi:tRNA threonylcarbamoyladenosine biosynthesis protein TsaE